MRPTIHILIPAAGASSRMRGRDKLLEPVRGKPILRHVVDIALETGAPVTVTLPPDSPARQAALSGAPVRIMEVPEARLGMAWSIRRGLAAILEGEVGPQDGLMVLPADMPGFSAKALNELVARFRLEPGLIWRGGTVEGAPGHPALFPRELWPELAEIEGDAGGRAVIQRHKHRERVVPLPGSMAVLDLDTPEDWAAYRGRPA